LVCAVDGGGIAGGFVEQDMSMSVRPSNVTPIKVFIALS
jgi:hypothetical protein